MPVTINSQNLTVETVASIVVTDAVDAGDGTFVRAVRFFGPPDTNGGAAPMLLEVRAIGASKAAITIATPAAGF